MWFSLFLSAYLSNPQSLLFYPGPSSMYRHQHFSHKVYSPPPARPLAIFMIHGKWDWKILSKLHYRPHVAPQKKIISYWMKSFLINMNRRRKLFISLHVVSKGSRGNVVKRTRNLDISHRRFSLCRSKLNRKNLALKFSHRDGLARRAEARAGGSGLRLGLRNFQLSTQARARWKIRLNPGSPTSVFTFYLWQHRVALKKIFISEI